jgi:hypothetical protein
MPTPPIFPLRTPLLALLLALPAAAPAEDVSAIRLAIDNDGSGFRAVLRAEGVLAEGCAPLPQAAERRGRDYVLTVVPGPAACLDPPQPFSLSSALLADPLPPISDGVHRLRLELQADPGAAPQLEAFALIASGSAAEQDIQPESGFWWGEQGGEFDRATPGFGVQLELQDGVLAVAVSGYADDGRPEWLFGATPVSGSTASVPLGRLQGGRGPYGRFRSPQQVADVGRLHIEWLGPARAVFWFERPAVAGGIELRPISMVRFGFTGAVGEQWLGRWLLGGEREGDAVAARAIDFVSYEARDDGFVLLGARTERLECSQDSERPNSPPVHCQLLSDAEAPIEFDRIALRSLRGNGVSGRAVLLRIER